MSPASTLDNTFGTLLIGALLSMTLWGVTCTQTFDYFMNNTDHLLQKSIVALLWALDTFDTVLHSHIAYYLLVTAYGNPYSIHKSIWSLNALSLVTAIPTFIIRSMFARRIYQFSEGNIIIPAWILVVSICELVLAIIMFAKGYDGGDPAVAKFQLAKFLYASFSLGVVADLSVTITLCWLLQSAKSGFRKTNSIVNVLMVYVVNTGLLVTVVATLGLITYIAMPDNLIFVAFFMLNNKLYLNAYLATLNARGRLRGIPSESNIPLSGLSGSSSRGRDPQSLVSTSDEKSGSYPSSTLAISLQKTVERRLDDDEGKHVHAV